jgi:maltose O-acetyltransferase
MKADAPSGVLSNVLAFGTRFAIAARKEINPLLSKRSLVNLVSLLPSQSFTRTRTAIVRAAGVHVGEQSQVQGPFRVTGAGSPSDVTIGDHSLVTGHLHIDLGAPVRIGRGVRIGHSVTLLTVNHEVGEPHLRAGPTIHGPIEIGDGAWLASRVTVLPGVKIGAGAIVGAGAVVSRDVPPHCLVAGIPARVIRRLDANGSKPYSE